MQRQLLTHPLVARLWQEPQDTGPILGPDTAESQQPALDAIRTEYHLHTNLPLKVTKFEEYREHHSQRRRPTPRNPTKPWTPFRTRAEFEFAKFALDAHLNKRQVDVLLKVFRRCIEGEDSMDFKDHTDLLKMWDLASVLHTWVCSSCTRCKSYFINYVG